MNTSNSVPADSENTSRLSIVRSLIWEWIIKLLFPMLQIYAGGWVSGALNESGIIRSNRFNQRCANIREDTRQLWTRTVAVFHGMRPHHNVDMPTQQNGPRSSASTIMTHAKGRQSGQRRTPRRGGQAKKSSNDPDGGDGEPPRPSHGLPSSRPRTPPFRHSLTRPVIAGGA
jgi:hypothetical protein